MKHARHLPLLLAVALLAGCASSTTQTQPQRLSGVKMMQDSYTLAVDAIGEMRSAGVIDDSYMLFLKDGCRTYRVFIDAARVAAKKNSDIDYSASFDSAVQAGLKLAADIMSKDAAKGKAVQAQVQAAQKAK